MLEFVSNMWQLALAGDRQGIWFWAGIYALLVCSYSVVFQIKTRFWESTKGDLSALNIKRFGTENVLADQSYVSDALYRYEVDGKEYHGRRVSPWIIVASHNLRLVLIKQLGGVRRYPDGRVGVHYNPKNPRKSYLIVAGKLGIAVTATIGLAPLVSFWIRYS